MWTGGLRSPLLGFFVFHMVFASLLLPRVMAYGGALAAVAAADGRAVADGPVARQPARTKSGARRLGGDAAAHRVPGQPASPRACAASGGDWCGRTAASAP